MIAFWIVNLLIPGEPDSLAISTPSGSWVLTKAPSYTTNVQAIRNGQCAHTYSLEHPVSLDNGATAFDLAFYEMTPLLLGSSYLSGLSVTATQPLPSSEVKPLGPINAWPRERAMGEGHTVLNTTAQFKSSLEAFITAWPAAGQQEKVPLLVHHWLDALACWSFEDLYLSATTLLQIIAATQESIHKICKVDEPSFFKYVSAAAKRAVISTLSQDFKNMRNSLVHDGRLVSPKYFPNKSFEDCTVVAADVLNWFDEYMHSVLGLGKVVRKRFDCKSFTSLNAYSI